jgi:hypothetical protein
VALCDDADAESARELAPELPAGRGDARRLLETVTHLRAHAQKGWPPLHRRGRPPRHGLVERLRQLQPQRALLPFRILRPRDHGTRRAAPPRGRRPRGDALAPEDWPYFALDGVPYHGRSVAIVWDRTGERYGLGPGLHLLADGRRIGGSPRLERIIAPLPPACARGCSPRRLTRVQLGRQQRRAVLSARARLVRERSSADHYNPGWQLLVPPSLHPTAGRRKGRGTRRIGARSISASNAPSLRSSCTSSTTPCSTRQRPWLRQLLTGSSAGAARNGSRWRVRAGRPRSLRGGEPMWCASRRCGRRACALCCDTGRAGRAD